MRPIYIRRSSEWSAPPPRGPEAGTGRRFVVLTAGAAGTAAAGPRPSGQQCSPLTGSAQLQPSPWDQRVRNSAVIRCAPVCGERQCPSVFGTRGARLCLPLLPLAMGAQFVRPMGPVCHLAPIVLALLPRGQA